MTWSGSYSPYQRSRNPSEHPSLKPSVLESRQWRVREILLFVMNLAISLPILLLTLPLYIEGWNSWQMFLIVLVTSSLLGFLLLWTGRIGTELGLPFMTSLRPSFGWRGSYMIGTLRYLVSMLIGALGIWINAKLLSQVFISWNVGFDSIPPSSVQGFGINGPLAVSLCLSWLFLFVPSLFGINSLSPLIIGKVAVMTIYLLVLLIWAAAKVSGPGPLLTDDPFGASLTNDVSGVDAAKTVLTIVPYLISLAIPYIFNMSDFTRNARRPKDALMGIAIGTPIFFTTVAMVGMILISFFIQEFSSVFEFSYTQIFSSGSTTQDGVFVTFFGLIVFCSSLITNLSINIYPMSLMIAYVFPKIPMFVSNILACVSTIPFLALFLGTTDISATSMIPAIVSPLYETLLAVLAPSLAIYLSHSVMTPDNSVHTWSRFVEKGGGVSRGWAWKAFLALFLGFLVSAVGTGFTWYMGIELIDGRIVNFNEPVVEYWSHGWFMDVGINSNTTNTTSATAVSGFDATTLEISWIWRRVGYIVSMIIAAITYICLRYFLEEGMELDLDATRDNSFEMDMSRDKSGSPDSFFLDEPNDFGV